jgi:hypothetical protein
MGLYQSSLVVFNQTITVAGTYNSASFSAANWNGGVLFTTVGTVTGTSPTLATVVQIGTQSTAGGPVTWTTAPSLASSLSPSASTIGLSMNLTSYTPVLLNSGNPVSAAVGSAYVGNLLRVQVTAGGTGSLSIPLTYALDMQKRFGDNS